MADSGKKDQYEMLEPSLEWMKYHTSFTHLSSVFNFQMFKSPSFAIGLIRNDRTHPVLFSLY